MSYRIKVPPKKSPVDEAQLMTGMERLWLAAEENRRGILAGLVVFLVAVAVVAGAIWFDVRQAQQALELDEEATRFYVTRPADNLEQATKNLRQAINLYRQVVKEFPRSSVAPHSLFRLGIALEEDNDTKGAIEAYQKFVDTYGDSQQMLGLVYQRLGYAFLLSGEREKAEQAFSSVLAVPGALNRDYAVFELAKLEEAQSRPEGALARYQELLKDYPHSPLVGEASVRMKALEVQETAKEKPGEANEGQEAVEQSNQGQ